MKTPLIDSKYLDKDIIYKRFGMGKYEMFRKEKSEYIKIFGKDIYEKKLRENDIEAELKLEQDIIRQYMNENVEDILVEYGEEKVVRFLNNLSTTFINSELPKCYGKASFGELSEDIKRRFYDLSQSVNTDYSISFDDLQFLRLCRVCFDSAPRIKFDEEVSDYYVYAYENKIKMGDNIRLIKDINNDINRQQPPLYNIFQEERGFNKMEIYNTSVKLVKNNGGNYEMEINLYYLPDLIRGILMYIGLREKGYNIVVNAKEVLKAYEKYNLVS